MESRIARFGNALTPHVEASAEVLDFGCGSGDITRALADTGLHMTGCDASTGMIRQAKAASGDTRVRWVGLEGRAGEKLPFDTDAFDAVIASSVFEYLTNPTAQATEIFRVLKPGGWFLLTVPDPRDPVRWAEARKITLNRLAPFRWLVRFTRWRDEFTYLKLSTNRWQPEAWNELLHAAGFVPETLGDCGGPLLLLSAQKPFSRTG